MVKNFHSDDAEGKIVLNHRYSNRNYVTISAKKGRKVCGKGFPVILPRKQLNEFLFFQLNIGTKTSSGGIAIPIFMNLTEDEPLTTLRFSCSVFEAHMGKPSWVRTGCDLRKGYTTEPGGWGWCTEPLYGMRLPAPEEVLILSPSPDEDALYTDGNFIELKEKTYGEL